MTENLLVQQKPLIGDQSLRLYGRTFWFATRMLPSHLRKDVSTLYAFCRYLDDLVDESHNAEFAAKMLRLHWQEIQLGKSSHPVVSEFLSLQSRQKIPNSYVEHLLHGLLKDTGSFQIADEAELIQYCYRVASTVGLMICAVFKAPVEAHAFAIDLGIAMQLTNISRDVREDARREKFYLPKSLVSKQTIIRALEGKAINLEQVFEAQRATLLLAEKYYDSANKGVALLPFGVRRTTLTASNAYRAIGHKLLKDQKRFFFQRCSTSFATKVMSAVKATGRVYADDIRASSPTHETLLHASVEGYPGVMNTNLMAVGGSNFV